MKKTLVIMLSIATVILSTFGMAFSAHGANTAAPSNFSVCGYDQKASGFIKDSRWKNGIKWTGSQKPKLSSYRGKGCCAYCADFVKYAYNKNNFGSKTFKDVNAIRNGDVLYMKDCYGEHWIVVLYRSSGKLYTAEGNVLTGGSYKTKVSKYKTYSIKKGKIYSAYTGTYFTLKCGYHF